MQRKIKFNKVNQRRWKIEESFRIMKTDFKSRPVYHTRDEMIKAHFTTCYLALVLYRYLEKKLNEEYTAPDIIETLRNMEGKLEGHDNHIPNYIRTDLTDALHDKFSFITDYEAMHMRNLKKFLNKQKIKKCTHFLFCVQKYILPTRVGIGALHFLKSV